MYMTALFFLSNNLALAPGFLIATIIIAHVIRQRRSPSGTIAWLLVIVVFPYIGVPLYLMLGGRKIQQIVDSKADVQLPTDATPSVAKVTLIDRLLQGYKIPGATTSTIEALPLIKPLSGTILLPLITQLNHGLFD